MFPNTGPESHIRVIWHHNFDKGVFWIQPLKCTTAVERIRYFGARGRDMSRNDRGNILGIKIGVGGLSDHGEVVLNSMPVTVTNLE